MKDTEKLISQYDGKMVKYAGAWYECIGVHELLGTHFAIIYDEPPSDHTDMIQIGNIEGVKHKHQ